MKKNTQMVSLSCDSCLFVKYVRLGLLMEIFNQLNTLYVYLITNNALIRRCIQVHGIQERWKVVSIVQEWVFYCNYFKYFELFPPLEFFRLMLFLQKTLPKQHTYYAWATIDWWNKKSSCITKRKVSKKFWIISHVF